MAPKPKCPSCGKRKWKKKSGTGSFICIICRYMLQDYRNETIEGGPLGQHSMRKRTLKSTRTIIGKKSGANPILYHGDRARYHYFQCLQVLLRMQITKLTEIWKVPPDFEIVCRDTWALHLSLLPSPPPPEPFIHAQQHDDDDVQKLDFAQKAKSSPRKETREDRNIDEAENVSESSDTDSSSAPDDEGSDEESPRMDDLMKEASEAETSESDEEDRGRGLSQVKRTSQRRTGMRWRGDDDSPAATICVLVHSCWLMRIPVIYKDFISLIETYTLPYLDPIRLFPQSLTRHLTKYAKQALSPNRAPTPILLHTISSRLARRCFGLFGNFTPEYNTAPVLWRAVRHMGGPPSLYAVSKALAQYLELPMTINTVMAPPLFKQSRRDPTSHKSDNIPPELALVATVIIALKLIYGFDDGKQVTPKEDWDPAHTLPALEVYINHLQTLATSEIKSSRSYLSSPSADMPVQAEDEQSLDAYLDFCERALLDRAGRDSKAAGNNDLIGEFYPVQTCMERTGSPPSARLGSAGASIRDEVLPVLGAARFMSDELKGEAKERKMLRERESYAMYSGHDELGRVPDIYAIVLGRGVGFCGVSENDLSAVVERFERRVVRLWKKRQRRDKLENGTDSDDEEDGYKNNGQLRLTMKCT
ncbi:hypothetical protein ACEPAI_6216 [Sanghuangporus weigelae]